jgi:molecular chaperone GrpE (heat shock protein)
MNTDNDRTNTGVSVLGQALAGVAQAFGFGGRARGAPEPVTEADIPEATRIAPHEPALAPTKPKMANEVEPPMSSAPAAPPPAPAPPIQPIGTGRENELLAYILESLDQVRESLPVQFHVVGKGQETLAQQVERMEANYKQALSESHTSILRLSETVRALEDKAFKETLVKPMLRELIALQDSLTDLHTILVGRGDVVPVEAVSLSDAVSASLTDILARQGVTRMPDGIASLDLRRQKIIRVERTPVLKDGEIIAVERAGYEWDGQVLRPQEVAVRKME